MIEKQNIPTGGRFLPKGFITPEKVKTHAEILCNSVRRRFRHLSKRFKREHIDCFRLYDWDSPDIRVVVDWYKGHVVVAEYERIQTGPEYLPHMASAVAEALGVDKNNVHIKRRHTNVKEGLRYSKLSDQGRRLEVQEGNFRFLVNLSDYLDTGLFSDHRNTRKIISQISKDKDFLNLFSYTGTFTCAAAYGGARSSVSVDRNQTYISWTKDNLMLNGLLKRRHAMAQTDAMRFLQQAYEKGLRFTLAFIDPPSFFKNQSTGASFDVNRDHPQLLTDALKLMLPGSDVFFSTNHQQFHPRFENLAVKDIIELTPKTIPEDYRNRNIHNCWHIKV